MKVKICGMTSEEPALCAAQHGADAIGFIFAESKRKIAPETTKNIISKLPREIIKVGVFVNEDLEIVKEIVSITGINLVQLHGDESPEYCRSIPFPTIKAFSIASVADLMKVHDYPCEYILLDGPKGKYHGGNGIAFDWDIIKHFDFKGKKVILAGGLNPQNVAAAIKEANPFMVDVSSGVETNGVKDLEKIKIFLNRVKGVHTL